MNLNDIDAAYIACAIDTEGSISFKSRRDKKQPHFFDLRIQITNTNYEWLEWMQKEIGGSLSSNGPKKDGRKKGWRLQIDGNQGRALIERIRPFLFIKQAQADLALNYKPTRWQHGRTPLSEKVKQERAKMFYMMKALNQRGDKASALKSRHACSNPGCPYREIGICTGENED